MSVGFKGINLEIRISRSSFFSNLLISCDFLQSRYLHSFIHLLGLHCRRRQWHPTPVLLPGKIPWMEEPGRLQSMGSLESDMTEQLHFHFPLSCIGEGNGTHSSVLAWRIPGTVEPVGCHLWGRTESDTTDVT